MAESSSSIKNKAGASKCSSDEEEKVGNIDLGLSMKNLSLGPKKKLLIMGIGGFLCHRVCHRYGRQKIPTHRLPDASYGSFYGHHSPFDFLLSMICCNYYYYLFHLLMNIWISNLGIKRKKRFSF